MMPTTGTVPDADHARGDCRRVSAGNMGCHKRALLLSSGVAHRLKDTIDERFLVLRLAL